jgi:hypothetical protein
MREHTRRSSFVLPVALLCAAGASLITVREGSPGTLHGPRAANASVAIAVSLEDLARASSVIVKVTPLERSSAWENGRIVTVTRVRVDDVVAGATPGAARELRVRTLGGRVGDIGQLVEGEAAFTPSESSVVFLTAVPGPATDSAFVVAGRAQGQLLVRRDARGREIVRVGAVGELVDRRIRPPMRAPGRRITELDGSPLDALSIEVKRAWEVGHAK